MDRMDGWLSHLKETGRKQITIDNYRQKLTLCIRTLESDGRPTEPEGIRQSDIFFLKDNLGLSENSSASYLRTFGHWLRWCTGTDVVKSCDILWNREEPRRTFITADTFRDLMAAADERDRVILLLGGCMGLRRAEILAVRYADIHSGYLHIVGKGHGDGKSASLRIPPMVAEAIREWTAVRKRNGFRDESDGHIVVSYQAGAMRPMALTSLSHHIKALGESVGAEVTPHSLRRLFATSLYGKHVDLADIRTLMRHESINTTVTCYIAPDRARLDGIMAAVGF